ncbi:hypothetical protein M9458_010391, partial [Cirrhinus mrigala]
MAELKTLIEEMTTEEESMAEPARWKILVEPEGRWSQGGAGGKGDQGEVTGPDNQ